MPPTSATVPNTPDLSGPVMTTYIETSSRGDKMRITLTKVIDPAQGADSYTTPHNGKRFVGTVFALKGVSGRFSDDANSDAVLIRWDGQTYQPDFSSIDGFTKWNYGQFNVSATWTAGR